MRRATVLIVVALLLIGSGWSRHLSAQNEAPAPDKKDAADKDTRFLLLETLGSLAGSQLYQSYLNIGFIADGKAEGTYEEADIQQILHSVLALMDTLDKKLDQLLKLDLNKDDRESIQEIRRLSKLLRQQADELQAYWKSGDKATGDKYEKARKEAWAGISKLLGLDQAPASPAK
jgi:hypothetical protein